MSAPGSAKFWEEEDDAASTRAADYLARRRCGPWSETDQAELDAWLKESTAHHVAWLRVKDIAAQADRLAAVDALALKQAVPTGARNLRKFLFPLLAAASVALIAPFAIPYLSPLLAPPDRIDSTAIGGRTVLNFADRTQIELNTDTAVRFRMTTAERTVWLEKGEAWFHVSHDAAHPFTVIVGRHRVTDLGTEFLVRRVADTVDVTLLNGRANLSTDGAPGTTLMPGQDAVATPVSLTVTKRTPQELADALAWRQGDLVFRSVRLADAVAEINRYHETKIVIVDPAVADLKFTGAIRSDNFEGFLSLAQSVMKLRIDWQGKNILLSREITGKQRPHR